MPQNVSQVYTIHQHKHKQITHLTNIVRLSSGTMLHLILFVYTYKHVLFTNEQITHLTNTVRLSSGTMLHLILFVYTYKHVLFTNEHITHLTNIVRLNSGTILHVIPILLFVEGLGFKSSRF